MTYSEQYAAEKLAKQKMTESDLKLVREIIVHIAGNVTSERADQDFKEWHHLSFRVQGVPLYVGLGYRYDLPDTHLQFSLDSFKNVKNENISLESCANCEVVTKIRVAKSKGAEKIAKEILKRLVTPTREMLPKWLARLESSNNYHNGIKATKELLADKLGYKHGSSEDRVYSATGSNLPSLTICSDSIKFEHLYLKTEQALKVLEFIKTLVD